MYDGCDRIYIPICYVNLVGHIWFSSCRILYISHNGEYTLKENPTFIGKPKREWTPGPIFVEAPIKSIGRFYMDLSPESRRRAVRLAKSADRLPSHVLQQVYRELEREAHGPG